MQEQHPTDLERAVIATLCYFDVFDYPLTLLELRRWLYTSPEGYHLDIGVVSLSTLADLLETSPWLTQRIEQRDGFLFLRGRAATLRSRLERAEIAERKYRRAQRIARLFLRLLPSIRLVAVCNTLAYANSRDDSDIDFFIVTRPGTIWTTRLMTNLFTAALRVRPRAHVGRDTICLTFFTTPETLDFRSLQRHPQDLYLHYWINQLVPLADRDGTYDRFFLANGWLRSHLPYFRPYRSGHRRRVDALHRGRTTPDAGPVGAGGRFFERTARMIQQRILPAHLRAMANRDTRVIVNDHMLKFHDKDRRDQYRQAFERRFRSVVAPS